MFDPFKRNKRKEINVNDIDDLIGKVEIIDIREDYEFESGSIKSAKNIPMGELIDDPEEYLDKNKEYYILCHSGNRSKRACTYLEQRGFHVINIEGGVSSYTGSNME